MQSSRSSRIVFIDWMRGLAAVIMLQGHTFDAFMRPEERSNPPFIFSQFFGGEAAAIFLFLTGITYGMGMNRREFLAPWQRVLAALRRARYLFLLAVLFRLQTWSFSYPRSRWADLLKVDILNAMGATAALLCLLALFNGIDRVRWAVLAGALIAIASPLISGLNTAGIPPPIRSYFVPGSDYFSVFPWGAFLAFGVAAGSMLPLVERSRTASHGRERGDWNRVMQWSAVLGFALLLGGQYFSNLPYSLYAHSDFWLNSPALVSCKLGVALLLASGAFLWTEYLSVGWSWVRQLGTSSLVVYWVHIELTYGRWFSAYRQRLSVWECLAAAATLVVLMIGVSLAVKRIEWRRLPQTLGLGKFGLEKLGFNWIPNSEPAPVYTLASPYEDESDTRYAGRRHG